MLCNLSWLLLEPQLKRMFLFSPIITLYLADAKRKDLFLGLATVIYDVIDDRCHSINFKPPLTKYLEQLAAIIII